MSKILARLMIGWRLSVAQSAREGRTKLVPFVTGPVPSLAQRAAGRPQEG